MKSCSHFRPFPFPETGSSFASNLCDGLHMTSLEVLFDYLPSYYSGNKTGGQFLQRLLYTVLVVAGVEATPLASVVVGGAADFLDQPAFVY